MRNINKYDKNFTNYEMELSVTATQNQNTDQYVKTIALAALKEEIADIEKMFSTVFIDQVSYF